MPNLNKGTSDLEFTTAVKFVKFLLAERLLKSLKFGYIASSVVLSSWSEWWDLKCLLNACIHTYTWTAS